MGSASCSLYCTLHLPPLDLSSGSCSCDTLKPVYLMVLPPPDDPAHFHTFPSAAAADAMCPAGPALSQNFTSRFPRGRTRALLPKPAPLAPSPVKCPCSALYSFLSPSPGPMPSVHSSSLKYASQPSNTAGPSSGLGSKCCASCSRMPLLGQSPAGYSPRPIPSSTSRRTCPVQYPQHRHGPSL